MEEKPEKKSFWKNYMFVILALVYLVWPLDLIPEFLSTFIGPFVMTDDVVVMLVAIMPHVVEIIKSMRNKNPKEISQK